MRTHLSLPFLPAALILLAASASAQDVRERARPWPIPPRIDVSTQKAPAPIPVQRNWTVAMWDFPRFELNALISAPWRAPLLYESGPQGREVNGIRIYREDDPRVLDWHVYWMTKYGINLMIWDWYPHKKPDGTLDCSEPILSITCNQDWRGGRPGGPVTVGNPADLTRIIQLGIQTVMERKLRPFISLEAWNEFGEGAVVEPNVEQGYRWLEAISAGLWETTNSTQPKDTK